MNEKCPGITKTGLPCSAKPMGGGPYCLWHNPDRMPAAVAKGGRNSSAERRAAKLIAKGYATLGDINDVLKMAMVNVEAGKLDPKVANSMATLAGRIQSLTLGSDIESRLSEILKESGDIDRRITQLHEKAN